MAVHRGRTALAVVMLGLPLVLACAVAVLAASYDLTTEESLPGQLGSAMASVTDTGYDEVTQNRQGLVDELSDTGRDPLGAAEIQDLLLGSRLLPVVSSDGFLAPSDWAGDPDDLEWLPGLQVDTTDPVTDGVHVVLDGRLPETDTEIALTPGAARLAGVSVGDDATVATMTEDGDPSAVTSLRVVGIAVQQGTAPRGVSFATLPGVLGNGGFPERWLVDRAAPLTAGEIQVLNENGLTVLSLGVLRDPPPSIAADQQFGGGPDASLYAVAVVLILLETVLLAAPAFAVSVRQQRSNLALLAATGADARALRRVVLTEAALVSALAVAVGVLLGVLGTAVALIMGYPWLPGARGPVELPLLPLLVIVVLGLGAAVVAAWLPARSAARADIAHSLAGRRGSTRRPWRLGIVGAAVAVAGGAVTWWGAAGDGQVLPLAVGVLLSAVGTLLVVPLLVAALDPLARWLPLPLRLASRDTARAAGRSVAAVAAVAAAAGGVAAVSTWGLSTDAFDRANYQPQLAEDRTLVGYDTRPLEDPSDTSALTAALPADFEALPIGNLGESVPDGAYRTLFLPVPGCDDPSGWDTLYENETCQPGLELMDGTVVADEPALQALGYSFTDDELETLRRGGMLLLGDAAALAFDGTLPVVPVTVTTEEQPPYANAVTDSEPVAVPALVHDGDPRPLRHFNRTQAILLPDTAEGLVGQQVSNAIVTGPRALTEDEESALADVEGVFHTYTERGYQPENPGLVIAGVVLAAVLALVVGTLTASGLALVDARPTHEVLSDVGARSRTRRLVAGSTAFVIAAVGGLAGTVMGLGPGMAMARLATSGYYDMATDEYVELDPTLVVPWPVIVVLVVLLPLLLGTLVAATTRGQRAGAR